MCNVPVVDLGCLTGLLQSMAKNVQEKVVKASKLLKVVNIQVLAVIVIVERRFSEVTNAVATVNDC